MYRNHKDYNDLLIENEKLKMDVKNLKRKIGKLVGDKLDLTAALRRANKDKHDDG